MPMRKGGTQIIKPDTAPIASALEPPPSPWMASANASLYRNDVFQRISPDQWFQVCRIFLLAYFAIKKKQLKRPLLGSYQWRWGQWCVPTADSGLLSLSISGIPGI